MKSVLSSVALLVTLAGCTRAPKPFRTLDVPQSGGKISSESTEKCLFVQHDDPPAAVELFKAYESIVAKAGYEKMPQDSSGSVALFSKKGGGVDAHLNVELRVMPGLKKGLTVAILKAEGQWSSTLSRPTYKGTANCK